MTRRVPRPSPALVIACIALFVALGGVSYGFATGEIDSREIKNGTIRGKDVRDGTLTTSDIRNNQVRGADIRNSTIQGRDVALNTLGGNDIKESSLGAVPSAADATSLGGIPAAGYARKEAPAFAPAALASGVTVAPGATAPAYDIDAAGYVHLRGTAVTTDPGAAFTLPAGARPGTTSRFVVARGTSATATLTIAPSGAATLAGGSGEVSFDGVSFAAGG